jgi:hypothetical protein
MTDEKYRLIIIFKSKKMNTNKIHKEIDETFAELQQLFSSFDQEQINIVPFKGNWTAGQLAQHVIISGSGFIEIINGPVKDSERDPDKLEATIKRDFLNFDTKMKSPDFVVPPDINYKKELLLRSFEDINEKINQALQTLDLTKTCLAFELPVYGFLTRFEALYFILYHTQRHIHQLKNIYQKIATHSITIE